MVLKEIENHLENFIVPGIIPSKLQCHRAAAEHMEKGLSLSTKLAFTGKALPEC